MARIGCRTLGIEAPSCEMFHRIYFHLVWRTSGNAPLITLERAEFLVRFLRGAARHHGSYVLELGMVSTHVHALVRTRPTTVLWMLVQSLKGGSAAVANRELPPGPGPLRWKKAYSVTSVSPRALQAVRQYLRSQPNRHPTERIDGWGGDRPEFDREG